MLYPLNHKGMKNPLKRIMELPWALLALAGREDKPFIGGKIRELSNFWNWIQLKWANKIMKSFKGEHTDQAT